MRKRFMKRQQEKNVKFQSEVKSSGSIPMGKSRIFQQIEGSQFEDVNDSFTLEAAIPIQALAEPVPIKSIPPIQAFAEPMIEGMEIEYGWESSLLNLHEIDQVANILSHSQKIMIFTGAGISTESIKPTPGLPPLQRGTALKMLKREYYDILKGPNKQEFLQTYLFGSVLKILESRVGASHKAIADLIQILQKKNKTVVLVTQNVDNLHELASIETGQDPSSVKHIHGWVKTATCPSCKKVHDYKERLILLRDQDNIDFLLCGVDQEGGCNGVLTPDIVEYGEQVPKYDHYYEMAKKSDTIIVAGTSLRVTPANQLVDIVHKRSGKVIVFDLYSTQMQKITDIHVKAQLEYALPLLIWKLDDHIPTNELGIKDKILTFKYWGEFFDNWNKIDVEHSTKTLDEKINLFKMKFDAGLEDPIWKIHHI
ncbi:MAG: hypothetical protein EU530_03070 [Promethearchaeota archaeon]|nr:MAG: hypothetical protein EU530_03070 [Candidatus Lokiarchaeota archaeon]